MSQAKRQQNIAGYREAAWKIVGIPRFARNKLHSKSQSRNQERKS